jgi:hypothetical protein
MSVAKDCRVGTDHRRRTGPGLRGFTYSKQTTAVNLGPIQLNVTEKKTVPIPVWAGIGAILVGGVLIAVGAKRA